MDQSAFKWIFKEVRTLSFSLLILGILILIVLPSKVFAYTDNQRPNGGIYPEITVTQLKLAANLTKGESIDLTFNLLNVDNRVAYDFGYQLSIIDSSGSVYAQSSKPRQVIL